MSNLIIGYGTQGKKRFSNLKKIKKNNDLIFDPLVKGSNIINKFKDDRIKIYQSKIFLNFKIQKFWLSMIF